MSTWLIPFGTVIGLLLIIAAFRWWESTRLRQRMADQGLTLVMKKWLPFGPGARGNRTAIYFVNYMDSAGQLFRALVADVRGTLFFQKQERIAIPDDLRKFSTQEKERWFCDPAAIYKPE